MQQLDASRCLWCCGVGSIIISSARTTVAVAVWYVWYVCGDAQDFLEEDKVIAALIDGVLSKHSLFLIEAYLLIFWNVAMYCASSFTKKNNSGLLFLTLVLILWVVLWHQ